jgi:hypothetical protein
MARDKRIKLGSVDDMLAESTSAVGDLIAEEADLGVDDYADLSGILAVNDISLIKPERAEDTTDTHRLMATRHFDQIRYGQVVTANKSDQYWNDQLAARNVVILEA